MNGAAFISRAQLFRKLRAPSGRNPARYIHLARIEQAKTLLADTGFTVSEIAWRTGFSGPSYLRRVFLRETGERLVRLPIRQPAGRQDQKARDKADMARRTLTRQRYRDIILESLSYCQKEKGLILYAYVIVEVWSLRRAARTFFAFCAFYTSNFSTKTKHTL